MVKILPCLKYPISANINPGIMLSGAKEHAQPTCALLKMFSRNNIWSLLIERILQRHSTSEMLRVAESIQISPNTRFCSIKFTTEELMQTFCTEGLVISGNITIYFKPDYKLPPNTKLHFSILSQRSFGNREETHE